MPDNETVNENLYLILAKDKNNNILTFRKNKTALIKLLTKEDTSDDSELVEFELKERLNINIKENTKEKTNEKLKILRSIGVINSEDKIQEIKNFINEKYKIIVFLNEDEFCYKYLGKNIWIKIFNVNEILYNI